MWRRLEVEPEASLPKQRFFVKKEETHFKQKGIAAKQPALFDEFTMLQSVPNCKKCGLHEYIYSPKMPMTGEGQRGVFILAEAPGADEDRANVQLVGQAGELLRFQLRTHGFHLDRDAYKINAVNCRPTEGNQGRTNRTPSNAEINHCRPWWWEALQQTNPQFIWLLGASAIQAFFGMRRGKIFQNLEVGNWHRLCIPDPVTKAWVIPLYHPSYFVRYPQQEFYLAQEVEFAMEQLSRPAPIFEDEFAKLRILMQYEDVMSLLKHIHQTKRPTVFDFETNCLRPWREDSQVATVGMSIAGDVGYAFPMEYPHWTPEQKLAIKLYIRSIAIDPLIPKIAQSIQMENPWFGAYFDAPVQHWIWDTMVASHIEDCRDYFTGLKKQAFLKWGIQDYGSDISKYLTGYPFNRIMEAPLDKLLVYNAMDAMLTRRLFHYQQELFRNNSHLRKAYELFHEGTIKSSAMEIRGIPIDVEHYDKAADKINKRMDTLQKLLTDDSASQIFRERYQKEPNFSSTDDLKTILFAIKGLTPVKHTYKTRVPALDEEALAGFGIPFTQNLLKERKLKKIQDYIELFRRLQVSGLLHPSFNLHTVRTYRSSSNDPNFQNLPKRSDEGESIIRSGIVASAGNIITEVDYGSMEVRIICCYSQDPVLRDELNAGTDVHQSWTDYLKDYNVSRYDVKNGVVFPLFYGSYHGNIHPDLQSRGYRIPEEKIVALERDFWIKYHHTLEYRLRQERDYQATGYVQTLMGHRRSGLLRKTQIINTPVQATAFHCLLWSLIQLDNLLSNPEMNFQTQIRAQIHDSMWLIGPPKEFPVLREIITRIMTQDIRIEFPWITVPLLAEFETSPIGGNWLQMESA